MILLCYGVWFCITECFLFFFFLDELSWFLLLVFGRKMERNRK
jgi:hypothetical protein